jgi:hypothetical protein
MCGCANWGFLERLIGVRERLLISKCADVRIRGFLERLTGVREEKYLKFRENNRNPFLWLLVGLGNLIGSNHLP